MLKIFQAIADLATGAEARVADEHQQFLDFYRGVVESVPPEVATSFGEMKVAVAKKNGEIVEGWGIMLTATDFLFWKQHIAQGIRFSPKHGGVASVPTAMVTRLAQKAEKAGLTLEERQKLLALLDEIE